MAFAFTEQEQDIVLKILRGNDVSNILRKLMLTIFHRDDIGEEYPKVRKLMVTGACKALFPA